MNRTIKTLAGAAVLVSAVSLVPAFSVSALTISSDPEATGAVVILDGTEYKIAGLTLAEGANLEATTQTSFFNILTLTLTGNATLENIDLSNPVGEYNGVTYGGVSLVVSNGATLTLKNGVENANSIINTNGGTIIVDGTVTYQTMNAGKVKVTKNGNLTLQAGFGLDATSIEIDAEIAANGTVTSGNVTVPSSYNAALAAKTSLGIVNGEGVTSGAYVAPAINTTTNTFTVDAGTLTEINVNIVNADEGSTLVTTLNNKVTTFADIKDDVIAAILAKEGEDYKIGKILAGGNAVSDDDLIIADVTYSYEAYKATVKVTDTTGVISNTVSDDVSDPAETLQDVLDRKSISLGEGYGIFKDAEGTIAADLTESLNLPHDGDVEFYIVALPEEQEPEEQEPEEVFSAYVYLNDRTEDKKFANISYSYRVETEGVTLSSLLSANNINLGSKYALFTRVYDSEAKAYKFVKVDDLSSVIENHTSREYYIGAAEGITYLPYYDQDWYGSADYTEIDVKVALSDKTLANEANDLSESVQKEIKKNVEDKTASVHVYADPILPSADEKKEIEAAAKKRGIKAENIIRYFDVYAYAFVYNNSGYGHSHTLAELGDEVEIKLRFNPNSLPEVEKGKTRQYIVIRTHDGKIDFLKVELSKNGEVAKFKSDKFSTYALAYMDIDATVVTPNDDNKNVLAGVHVGDLGGFVNDDNSAKAASASIVTVLASAVTALGAAIAKLFKKSER